MVPLGVATSARDILVRIDVAMKRMKLPVRIVATMLLLQLVVVVAQSQKHRPLTQSEAVALAQQFITQNGYTDLPPDKTKLSYETIEWESNVDKMLAQRHDTLERNAYGFRSGRKGREAGWTVVFRFKHPRDPRMESKGRAVTMNLDGSKPRVEHVDFILRYATKL